MIWSSSILKFYLDIRNFLLPDLTSTYFVFSVFPQKNCNMQLVPGVIETLGYAVENSLKEVPSLITSPDKSVETIWYPKSLYTGMHGISSYHHGTHSAMEQNSPTIPLIIRSYLICLRIKVKWCHRGDILHYAADIISVKADSWVIPVQIISFKSRNSHTRAASLDTKVDGWVLFKILVRLPLSQKIKDKSLSINWSQLTQFTLDNNKKPESLQLLECIFYILIFIEYQFLSFLLLVQPACRILASRLSKICMAISTFEGDNLNRNDPTFSFSEMISAA